MASTFDDIRVTNSLVLTGAIGTRVTAGFWQTSELAQTPLSPFIIPLTSLRVWDAMQTTLPGTSAADDLGLYGGTFATGSPLVRTYDVKNAGAVTLYARFQCPIPSRYQAGETLTLRLSAGMVTTVASASATVDVEAYLVDGAGGIGSDLCATAAQSINSVTFANKDFTITPATLTAGGTLDVRLTVAVSDTATATAVIAAIGAITVLCDIQG